MNLELDHIAFRDDPFLFWRFNVSDDFVRIIKHDYREALNILYSFFSDYIELSEKYKLGELFPLSIKSDPIDIRKQEYLDFCKLYYQTTNSLKLFPLKNSRYQELRKVRKFSPSSCWYVSMNDEGELAGDYLFIDRKSIKRQSSFKEDKLPFSQENFDIHGFGVSIENVNNIVKEDIGFSLSIYSEFWFEKAFYGSDKNWDNGVDNSFYAKHNSPRLNTFLRDLKDLWVGKYGWELGDFEGWYGSNQDGIFLGNKIVYLDDTES